MKCIQYYIKTKAPLLIADDQGDVNMVATKDYITGSSVWGAFASKFKQINKSSSAANALHENPNLHEWFLSGDIIFTNAYKVNTNIGSQYINYPIPFSIQAIKNKNDDIYDLLLTDVNEQTKYPGGYGIIKGKELEITEIKKAFSPHQEYNPATRTTKENRFFNYESISPAQEFGGYIIGEDKALADFYNTFKEITEFNFGRSRTIEYGKTEFSFVSGIEDFKVDIRNIDWENVPKELSLTFLSDTIIFNENGFSTTSFESLKSYLKNKFPGFEITKSFIRTGTVQNYLSVWNLPRPMETCFLAGSALLLTISDNKEDIKKTILKLEEEGIGERRNEGFGRIAFGYQNEQQLQKHKVDVKINYQPPSVIKPEVRNKVQEILLSHLKTIIANNAYKDIGSNKLKITSSQIGRLEMFIKSKRNSQEFIKQVDSLRETSKDKLRSCKIAGSNLLEHIKGFKITDDKLKDGEKIINEFGLQTAIMKEELYTEYFLTLFPAIRKNLKKKGV